MRLTEKDRQFLTTLAQRLREDDALRVELVADRPSYMVLRGNYGDRVHAPFGVSRQGVRWRFGRLFNEVYVGAFTAILMIEQTFGDSLRQHAIRISRERHALRGQRELSADDQDRIAQSRKKPIKPTESPESA